MLFIYVVKKIPRLLAYAGVMACPESSTRDGFETQFGVNHLAHFLLFQLLKDRMLRSSTPSFPSKVVNLSSLGEVSRLLLNPDPNSLCVLLH